MFNFKVNKKVIALCMTTVFLVSIPFQAHAEEVNDIKISKKVNVDNLPVTIYEDGRVKKIDNPETLTDKQREKVLKLMRFTDEDIESFPETLENDLIADGGIKIELTEEDAEHIYTDLSGVDHVVTEENESEIAALKERDILKYKKSTGKAGSVSTLGGWTEGTFSGKGVLTYLGATTYEYKYKFRTTFNWSERPVFYFTDTIATAWQPNVTGVATTYDYTRYNNGYFSHDSNVKIEDPALNGTTLSIDIDSHSGKHYGYLEDEVLIPKTQANLTGQFASAYGHAYSAAWLNAILNYVGIELEGWGDKFRWKNTFKIGSTTLIS